MSAYEGDEGNDREPKADDAGGDDEVPEEWRRAGARDDDDDVVGFRSLLLMMPSDVTNRALNRPQPIVVCEVDEQRRHGRDDGGNGQSFFA